MRVVLDTNVVVSGVFFGGVPGRILSAWAAQAFDLVLSPAVLEEYQRVGEELSRRYPSLQDPFARTLTLLATHALMVAAPPLPEPVSPDPADDMFLAAALASNTSVIVSGDRHLLGVNGWRGITVIKPRAFVTDYLDAI